MSSGSVSEMLLPYDRPVVYALQVHTREGMPRLELVESRGCPFFGPGWGRVRLPFLPKHITSVQVPALAP